MTLFLIDRAVCKLLMCPRLTSNFGAFPLPCKDKYYKQKPLLPTYKIVHYLYVSLLEITLRIKSQEIYQKHSTKDLTSTDKKKALNKNLSKQKACRIISIKQQYGDLNDI